MWDRCVKKEKKKKKKRRSRLVLRSLSFCNIAVSSFSSLRMCFSSVCLREVTGRKTAYLLYLTFLECQVLFIVLDLGFSCCVPCYTCDVN